MPSPYVRKTDRDYRRHPETARNMLERQELEGRTAPERYAAAIIKKRLDEVMRVHGNQFDVLRRTALLIRAECWCIQANIAAYHAAGMPVSSELRLKADAHQFLESWYTQHVEKAI